jgi:hypothetical protein
MSLAQIAASDWPLVFATVLGWLLMIIFMVTTRRELSRVRTNVNLLVETVKLLSDEVGHLKVAEHRRLMMEINAGRERADRAHLETGQSSDNRPH